MEDVQIFSPNNISPLKSFFNFFGNLLVRKGGNIENVPRVQAFSSPSPTSPLPDIFLPRCCDRCCHFCLSLGRRCPRSVTLVARRFPALSTLFLSLCQRTWSKLFSWSPCSVGLPLSSPSVGNALASSIAPYSPPNATFSSSSLPDRAPLQSSFISCSWSSCFVGLPVSSLSVGNAPASSTASYPPHRCPDSLDLALLPRAAPQDGWH